MLLTKAKKLPNGPARKMNGKKWDEVLNISITLCRYEYNTLRKEVKMLCETEYVAISHVWGDVKWRVIEGIAGKVLVSEEKARFLECQLPSIIGDRWFWMDVLCIDQDNEE